MRSSVRQVSILFSAGKPQTKQIFIIIAIKQKNSVQRAENKEPSVSNGGSCSNKGRLLAFYAVQCISFVPESN